MKLQLVITLAYAEPTSVKRFSSTNGVKCISHLHTKAKEDMERTLTAFIVKFICQMLQDVIRNLNQHVKYISSKIWQNV